MKKQRYLSPRNISLLALFCALVVVATIVVRLPIPATGGYFNLGDTIIFITSILLGPVSGMVVGGVGSALADVFGGFAQFAPWTLVIKGDRGVDRGPVDPRVSGRPKNGARRASGLRVICCCRALDGGGLFRRRVRHLWAGLGAADGRTSFQPRPGRHIGPYRGTPRSDTYPCF